MNSVGIDIGGTFTDVVVMGDDGSVSTTKSPSTPGRLQEGLLAALTAAAEKEKTDLAALLGNIDRSARTVTCLPRPSVLPPAAGRRSYRESQPSLENIGLTLAPRLTANQARNGLTPRRAMTTSSPASTRANSRESWVLA